MTKVEALVNSVSEICTGAGSSWLHNGEGVILYNLAAQLPLKNDILEVGSWKGKSTIFIAKGAPWATVYAVDTFKATGLTKVAKSTYRDFKNNLKKAAVNNVKALPMKSLTAAKRFKKESLDMIFIDGDHNRAREDFDAWFPKLKYGGLMVMHDNFYYHVKDTILKKMVDSEEFNYIGYGDRVTYGIKAHGTTPWQRIQKLTAFYRRVLGNKRYLRSWVRIMVNFVLRGSAE